MGCVHTDLDNENEANMYACGLTYKCNERKGLNGEILAQLGRLSEIHLQCLYIRAHLRNNEMIYVEHFRQLFHW